MDKSYDLLPEADKNGSFDVKFDTRTPRPHFIITAKNQTDIKRDFSQMIPKQTKELMKVVQSMMYMMSSYSISRGILSIHRGSWLSKVPDKDTGEFHFHAHICVMPLDVELYVQVFEQKKGIVPYWSKKESYSKNVRDYHVSYLEIEVPAIEKLQSAAKLDLPEVQGISVILHPKHPKIGFVGKKIPLENLVWAIETFAQKLGLTDWTSKDYINGGCHVCLHLGLGKFIDIQHTSLDKPNT
jgi:hypothetical protein